MEMSYKQASKIRQKGLLTGISEKLVSGESIGASIKTSLKESSKAKAVGIKETFDPMNIARVVTGGSNIGPALIGRMLGRSTEDLEHFTNIKSKKDKTKEENLAPIDETTSIPEVAPKTEDETKPTSTKIKPDKGDEVNYDNKSFRWMGAQWGEVNPKTGKTGTIARSTVTPALFQIWSEGGFINVPEVERSKEKTKEKQTKLPSKNNKDGLSEALSKIYNLLQKSSEEKSKSADLDKDLNEERKVEDDRRHKELVEALLKIGGGTKREKEKTSSLLDGILGLLSGLFSIGDAGAKGKGGVVEEGKGKGGAAEEGKGKGGVVEEGRGADGKGGAAEEGKGGIVEEGKGADGKGGKAVVVEEGKGKGGIVEEGKGADGKGGKSGPLDIRSRIEPTLKTPSTPQRQPGTPLATAEKFLESQNKKSASASKVPKLEERAPKNSNWMKDWLKEVSKKNITVPETASQAVKTIANNKAYNGLVNSMKWLASIPGIQLIPAGLILYNELDELKNLRSEGLITDDQLRDGMRRAWSGAFGGIAGAELGALMGGAIGVPVAGAAAATGVGALAAPFVELGFALTGGVLGYYGGDKLGRYLSSKFLEGHDPLIEATPGMKNLNENIKKNRPDTEGFVLPVSSIQMESPSESLSKVAVGLTNENRELNLMNNVASLEPTILENNVNNMKNGRNQTRVSSPDGSIRTTNDSINWAVRSNVRTV